MQVARFELRERCGVVGENGLIYLVYKGKVLVVKLGMTLECESHGRRVVRHIEGACTNHVVAEVDATVGFLRDHRHVAAAGVPTEEFEGVREWLGLLNDDRTCVSCR